VDNTWHLGSGFNNYSTIGGPQYELAIQWYMYYGNWWLNVSGTWVGYYPGTIYNGGQLSRNAQIIEYGGETDGVWYWAPMGSGDWATGTWLVYPAYQHSVYYFDTASNGQWASLTGITESPNCYSVGGPFWYDPWGIYFYFGGPGGGNC
jgi:hypothetical protein